MDEKKEGEKILQQSSSLRLRINVIFNKQYKTL